MSDWFWDHPNRYKDVHITDTKLNRCSRARALFALGTSILADTSNKADWWPISAFNTVQCSCEVEVLPDGPEPIIFFVEEEQFRVPDLGHFSSRLHKGDNPFTKKLDQVFYQPSRISAKSSHNCILIESS